LPSRKGEIEQVGLERDPLVALVQQDWMVQVSAGGSHNENEVADEAFAHCLEVISAAPKELGQNELAVRAEPSSSITRRGRRAHFLGRAVRGFGC
jgi:hypothetical protein